MKLPILKLDKDKDKDMPLCMEYIYLFPDEREMFYYYGKFNDYKYNVVDLVMKLLLRQETYLPSEIRIIICDYLLYYTYDERDEWIRKNKPSLKFW